MFDVTQLIREPAAGERFDAPLSFFIFDRRALQTLDWHVDAIKHECGDAVTLEELQAFAEKGWFPLIEGPWLEHGTLGAPLYTPSRVGMLLKLQRQGLSDEELADVVEREEWYIDVVLTSEDWAYEDDDLELLRLHSRSEKERREFELERIADFGNRDPDEVRREVAKHAKFLARYDGVELSALPLERQNRLSMAAFEMRFNCEMLRVQLLNWERQQVEAGYSPGVFFSRSSHSRDGFEGDVSWRTTLGGLGEKRDQLPIRLPGFIIRNGKITTTETLTPSEYKRLWDKHRLDEYLRVRAELEGQRTCLHCHKTLQGEADRRRLYCGSSCQNAAKQRRYRQNNPEEISRIQQRYWSSLDGAEPRSWGEK